MLRWLRRLLRLNRPDWLRKLDETAPIPLQPRPPEWNQRHAGRTAGDLLERQRRDEIVPPGRTR